MLEVKEFDDNSVDYDEMKVGDIAIITKWGSCPKHIGCLVYKYSYISLVCINKTGLHWISTDKLGPLYKVKILNQGTILVVT